ncbi:hypothetical protein IJ670_04830 [bacterium]|nr:hypothetical protein [bacterium]
MLKNILKYFSKKKLSALKSKITKTKKSSVSFEDKSYEKRIEAILQKAKTPDKILKFIKKAKTPVYVFYGANKVLSEIGEKTGLIFPKKGLKALYLNLVLNHKISFKTKEMFVFEKNNISHYLLSYDFYRWYCFKKGIKGYTFEVQNKFKNIFQYTSTSKINDLTFDEILELKEAIQKDIEAINFTKQYAMKNSMSKQVLNKMLQGEKVSV